MAEVPSMQDFKSLEDRLNSKLEEIKSLLMEQGKQVSIPSILTVKEVTQEYRKSPHLQRVARAAGYLIYDGGSKEIQYNRSDVEAWVQSTTVK